MRAEVKIQIKEGRMAHTVVPSKYVPPFATLALVQNTGWAYTRDVTFSLAPFLCHIIE